MLRVKGFFWLATRPRITGLWSQAGPVARFGPSVGYSPEDLAGDEPVEPRQGLVFIGTALERGELEAALRACLLTGAEAAADGEALPDPFPEYADRTRTATSTPTPERSGFPAGWRGRSAGTGAGEVSGAAGAEARQLEGVVQLAEARVLADALGDLGQLLDPRDVLHPSAGPAEQVVVA